MYLPEGLENTPFNMWTTKHLAQASCTELPLQKMAFIRPTLPFIGSDGLLEESKLQQCVESSFAEAAAGFGAAADAQWPKLLNFVHK